MKRYALERSEIADAIRRLSVVLFVALVVVSAPRIAAATGYVTGSGRFERIAGNPSAGYAQLYEWDLFLSPADNSYVGPSRRLGAPPGQTPTGDGYYRIDDVPPGDYSVYVNQPDFFASPKVVPNVAVVDGRGTTVNVDLDVDYSTYFAANNQWTPWEWDYYQTFQATGTSIRGISWRHAGGGGVYNGRSAVITVMEKPAGGAADPRSWTPLGSLTDTRIAGDSDEWVRWSAGGLPITPGNDYAVRVHVDGGMAIYKRDKDAQSYPLGRAFDGNGNPQNFDLNLTVFVDKKYQNVTHTRTTSGPGLFDGGLADTRWGQTFVATGQALAAVDLFAAGSSGFPIAWTIRDGGPGGTQVGPTKTVESAFFASSTALAGVSYDPGEVSLTPGNTYYIEAYNPSGFTPYMQEAWNAFADGLAYRNGAAQPTRDLSMTIVEYASIPPTPIVIALTDFDEPAVGASSFSPTAGQTELGFQTASTPSGGQNPAAAAFNSGSSPTSPVFSHRSVDATTTFDAVSLAEYEGVEVSLLARARDTGYETGDYVHVYLTDGTRQIDLLNQRGETGLNDLRPLDYVAYSAAIPDEWASAQLIIASFGNSSTGAERYDFDGIRFTGFLSDSPTLIGDANGDGRVDAADVAIVAAHFGLSSSATPAQGDFNGDGRVGLADLIAMQGRFGSTISANSAAAVPEPSAWTIAWTFVAAIALRRSFRRRIATKLSPSHDGQVNCIASRCSATVTNQQKIV